MRPQGLCRLAAWSCGLLPVLVAAADAAGYRPGGPAPVPALAAASGPCFELPGAATRHRRRHECRLYSELGGLDRAEYPHTRDAVELGPPAWAREAWASLAPGDGRGARWWAGQRRYKRSKLKATGFAYWDATGAGVGVDRISTGAGRLAVAYFASASRDTRMSAWSDHDRLDLRLEDLAAGAIDLGIDLRARRRGPAGATAHGAMLTLRHARGVAPRERESAVQLGLGAAHSLAAQSDPGAERDALALRVLHQLNRGMGRDASLRLGAFVEHRPRGPDWVSAGIRPRWRLRHALTAELRYRVDHIGPHHGRAELRQRLTAALALHDDADLGARPQLRWFVAVADGPRPRPGRLRAGQDRRIETVVGTRAEHLW